MYEMSHKNHQLKLKNYNIPKVYHEFSGTKES